MSERFLIREAWLTKLLQELREGIFAAKGYTVPDNIRVSVGWPRGSRKAIGQCWPAVSSADKTREIFISPALSDPMRVADVLAHEVCHAALPEDVKHGKPFADMARAIGLVGKPTATEAGPEFKAWAEPVLIALGDYPHGRLSDFGRKKQATRLLRIHCPVCEDEEDPYILRASATTIAKGLPICPIHETPLVAG